MNTHTIPNITVKELKHKKSVTYYGLGSIPLPCWNGYFSDYHFKNVITDGMISLSIDNSDANHNGFHISPEQTNAYYYLVENQERIKQQLLQGLTEVFPDLLSNVYDSYDLADFPRLSDLVPGFDFKNYIGPSNVHIETDVKDNIAYTSWHFNCLWDPEHGMEIITHKERIIEIAPQADKYKINEDNGTAEAGQESLDDFLAKMQPKKKWWKFW